MSTLIDQRDVLVKELEDLRAKGDALTEQDVDDVLVKSEKLEALMVRIGNHEKAGQKLASLGRIDTADRRKGEVEPEAKSLGEHFVKSVGDRLLKSGKAIRVNSPEYKAASDVHMVTTSGVQNALRDVDTTVVQKFRERPTVAALLSSGTMTGTSLTYFVEGAEQGDFEVVPEGGLKPQMHFDYEERTDGLAKIAGIIKESDEMIKDLPFLASAINNRLLYKLSMFEEAQILLGDGKGQNLHGLLNRSGIQTEAAAATAADRPDAIFRAMTKVQTATGFTADGVIINPLDYQEFRLNKDGNGQYFGGGYFQGEYGNGGVALQPALWGLPTVVTSMIPKGTALVGAFKVSSTLYRKGGIEVEATNSNEDDFNHNRVSIRAEERIGLAARVPAALVKVTFGA